MGWFSSIFAARRTREQTEPRAPSPYGRSVAGVYVTPDTALKNATVWACVRYLSTTVAQLPWYVKRELPSGGSEVVKAHPTANVLSWRTNPELGPFQFRETLMAWALLYGNGYAEIVRDGAGRVVEMWPIHPARVEVRRDLETDRLFYRVTDARGGAVDLDPMDVFHLRGFGHDPVGLSIVEYAAETLGWAKATELFGASYFGNGMHPAGFIEGAGTLTPEGKSRLREALEKMFRGPSKAFRYEFLDAGMKWTKVGVQPNEAQFIETAQFQVEQICRWFGVPPHKVMHLLRMTNNNIEHIGIEVVTDAISPWTDRLADEANYKLFGLNRRGLFTMIDTRGLMRGDAKARGEYYQMRFNTGSITPSEIREIEGDNPAGAASANYFLQSGFTTLERIVDPPEPAAPAGASAAPAPAEPAEPDEDDAEDAPTEDMPDAALLERIRLGIEEVEHVAA